MSLEIEERVVADIMDNSEAYENLLVLTDDIGSRLAGTENEVLARDFLLEMFRRYGLENVKTESFEHRAWTPVSESLLITEPIDRELACRCGGLSPSTPGDGVEAEVVFLDQGDRAEFEQNKDKVRGRIVVIPYYPIARQLKTPMAAEYGAAGLLETRNYRGSLQPARTCAFAKVGAIPVASISKEDAEYLKRLESRKGKLRIRLALESRVEVKPSWNVMGDLGGEDGGSEHILIGGHYDSWHVGPGAIDNAAGVVAVLEAARGLARYSDQLKRRVRFILLGVEESGLVGAWAYTRDHAEELDEVMLMINNDVGGRPSGIGVAGFPDLKSTIDEVAERVQVAGDDLPPYRVSVGGPGWGSDHFPFLIQGIPTIGIATKPVDPEDGLYGHTRGDTPDKVYELGLTECAAINARLLLHLSNLPDRPTRRKTRAEVEQMIRSHDFMETLELLDVWPPEHALERYFNFE